VLGCQVLSIVKKKDIKSKKRRIQVKQKNREFRIKK
jgi:hypothetical protein